MACIKVELSRQNRKAGATLFAMNKITQTARYRQSLILYAQKHGVTAAAKRYRTYRQYIYRWMKRYDGTLQSLEDHSHRPHSHANQHRPEEIKLIDDMRRRNPNAGLVVFWVKLRQRGYSRSISGLYRFLRKRGQMAVKLPHSQKVQSSRLSRAEGSDRCEVCSCILPGWSCRRGCQREWRLLLPIHLH